MTGSSVSRTWSTYFFAFVWRSLIGMILSIYPSIYPSSCPRKGPGQTKAPTRRSAPLSREGGLRVLVDGLVLQEGHDLALADHVGDLLLALGVHVAELLLLVLGLRVLEAGLELGVQVGVGRLD